MDGLCAGLLSLRQVQVHLVPVEVGVVGGAHALIETQRAPWHDLRPVGHDRQSVQRGLAIEEHDVAIPHVAVHCGAVLQAIRQLTPEILSKGSEELPAAVLEADEARARVLLGPMPDGLPEALYVRRADLLRERHPLGDPFGHHYLLHADIRVGRYDRAPREVHTLSIQIAAKAALLPLQPRADGSDRMRSLGQLQTRGLGVDVCGNLLLQPLPGLGHLAELTAPVKLLLQIAVRLDDVLHGSCQVVLSEALVAHGHRRSDANGGHRQSRQNEALGLDYAEQLTLARRHLPEKVMRRQGGNVLRSLREMPLHILVALGSVPE
mmetsp:Transcript_69402/g.196752  ORF Transcript_69402/g.196752 Transcript_69402/m.196752 type:complete len:322 (+) Transcript_69402:2868-3833(+)